MALLDENRFFPTDSALRDRALALYNEVRDLPIISPHGHTDPQWFAKNQAFRDPAQLFVTPDHYVFRMLHSQGIPLEAMGVPRADGGRAACRRWACRVQTVARPNWTHARFGACSPRIFICSEEPLRGSGSSTHFKRFLGSANAFQARLQMPFMTR